MEIDIENGEDSRIKTEGEYKNEDIEAFFDKKINNDEDNNKLSILLACQVLFKFKKIIKERIQKARAQVKKKNSS